MGDNLHALLRVESVEERTLHDDTPCGVDTALGGDWPSSEDIVCSTHLDGEAHMVTSGDGLAHTGVKGIFNTSDGNRGHVARKVFVRNFIGGL